MQLLEEQLRRLIIKSRPYFDEKALCQEQLNTQKDRIDTLKKDICKVKTSYAQSLKELEQISNEIHMKRKGLNLNDLEKEMLTRPREPGVGAELTNPDECSGYKHSSLPDFNVELDKCELRSIGSYSETTSSAVSEKDENEVLEEDSLDDLKMKVKELAVRPIEGGEGKSSDSVWESELKSTVDKLDHMMLMQECSKELNSYKTELTITPVAARGDINCYKTELTIIPSCSRFEEEKGDGDEISEKQNICGKEEQKSNN